MIFYPSGEWFFISNPITGPGMIPKWDFIASSVIASNYDAFAPTEKAFGASAPTGTKVIDWLYHMNTGGGYLAHSVYIEGHPLASCTVGSEPHPAKYTWVLQGLLTVPLDSSTE